MLYGYETPVNFADIVSTDNSIYSAETLENMDIITRKAQLASYTPNTIVVVPIVGVPSSVQNYQSTVVSENDLAIQNGDYTIYDLKVGGKNFGAEGYDNLDSRYSTSELDTSSLKNSVQIIGFAKFRLKAVEDYNRSTVLGDPLDGQIRGDFIGYVVDPREMAALLEQYNYGN